MSQDPRSAHKMTKEAEPPLILDKRQELPVRNRASCAH